AGGDVDATHDLAIAFIAVPDGNAVSPPQLPGDIPVADVLQPVDVDGFPTLGQDADGSIPNCLECRLGEWLHLHEPLVGEARLYDGVAAVAVTDGVLMRPDLTQLLRLLQRADDSLASLEPVNAEQIVRDAALCIDTVGHRSVGRHDHRHRQMVAFAYLEIVRIVSGRYLDDTSTEGGIDVLVSDDRDLDPGDRQYHGFSDQLLVAFVIGMNGNRNIAEHRLRPRRRDGEAGISAGVGDRVGDVIQIARLLAVLRFLVAQGGHAPRAPVNHAVPAIDQTALIQLNEGFANADR